MILMNFIFIIEIIFFILCFIMSIILLIINLKKDDKTDYYKLINIYNNQLENAIKKLKNGNKKIDNIEVDIRKYKKYLGLKK